jgi:tetratricopeptide (TPR) repeat protein
MREKNGPGAAGANERRIMEETISSLRRALELRESHSECHALLCTVYGMLIADNPASALWFGRKVQAHRKAALSGEAENPRTYYLMGVSTLRAPGFLASKAGALKLLLRAEELFEFERKKDLPPVEPTWGYDHCLAFIGECYTELGEPGRAREYYLKALRLNPGHGIALKGIEKCGKETETR